ncbi:hypothetical protein BGZ88_006284 [Linnemannia elongata]|nr:hypothetical protein BGZ88_006284 [Linnemannia elongata]
MTFYRLTRATCSQTHCSLQPPRSVNRLVLSKLVPKAFRKFFKSERVKSSEGAYENKFVCRTCNKVLSSTADPVHSGVMFARTGAGGGAVANVAPGTAWSWRRSCTIISLWNLSNYSKGSDH